jgi:hypothetical protein
VSDNSIPTTIVEIVDVDMAMFRLRLAGKSTRAIARELRVAEDKVRATVEKMLTPITPQLKLTALQEALERFDLYQASQHEAAVKGDRDAIAMCLKIEEQRADLLGTRAPAAVRIDPIQLVEQAQPLKNSSERLLDLINQIRAERIDESPTDKSVRLLRSRTANGSPSGSELAEFAPVDPEPDPAEIPSAPRSL